MNNFKMDTTAEWVLAQDDCDEPGYWTIGDSKILKERNRQKENNKDTLKRIVEKQGFYFNLIEEDCISQQDTKDLLNYIRELEDFSDQMGYVGPLLLKEIDKNG